MKWTQPVIFLVAVITLTLNVSAVSWSSSVDTNASHWYIYRQSSNVSFDLSSEVEGKISPVEFHNRMLQPYYGYYGDIRYNDVQIQKKTSALNGDLKSADETHIKSIVYPNDIEIVLSKPVGTNIYTIEYTNETWPVFMTDSRSIDYSGMQINDRDFEENNGDSVGTSILYNHQLSKEQITVLWLQKMNATVLATDDSIIMAKFKPTKFLGYQVKANTTGIADLSYRLGDSQYDTKHHKYPALGKSEERYYGAYNLTRKIKMVSEFEDYVVTISWLPCCDGGWDDGGNFEIDDKDVFDCSCYDGL